MPWNDAASAEASEGVMILDASTPAGVTSGSAARCAGGCIDEEGPMRVMRGDANSLPSSDGLRERFGERVVFGDRV